MKKNIFLLLLFLAFILNTGCDLLEGAEDTTEEIPEKKEEPPEVLVSEQLNNTISQQQLEAFWSGVNQPEALAFLQYDVDIYYIEYNTVDVEGQPVEASGAILVPKGIENPKLLSIQHETIFFDDEAPSVSAGFSIALRYSIFSSAGYIVFLPDYIGYGITGDQVHPYQQAGTLASASYDMIRAGLEFIETNELTSADQPVHMIGYSEGAYATLALAHFVETTDSEITPGFLSLGGGIYDLTKTSDHYIQNINESTSCLACYAYFLYTVHQMYEFPRPLSDYFQSPYDQVIADGLFDGSFTSGQIDDELPETGAELFEHDFIQRYLNSEETEFANALTENDLFYIPDADVLLVHGEADDVAPIFNSDDFEVRALSQGKTNFEYIKVRGADHNDTVLPWGFETLSRLQAAEKLASDQ